MKPLKDIAIPVVPKNIDFYPTSDFLLLLEIKPGVTAGGIELPDRTPEEIGEPTLAIVVAAGPGRIHEVVPNHRWPMNCDVGDVIWFGGPGCIIVEFPLPGFKEKFLRVRDRDITGHAIEPRRK